MFRRYDAAFFSPPDDGDTPPAGGAAVSEDDLAKLRSTKDREIAELKGQLGTLQSQINEITAAAQGDAIVTDVQKKLDDLDELDPKYSEKVKELTLEVAKALSNVRSVHARDVEFAYDQAASVRAYQLLEQFDGDFEEIKSELAKAKSLDEMNTLKEKLEIRLERDGKKRTSNGQRFRVDEGRGGGQASTVLTDMQKIDVTTPEGQAEWEKREAEFERRIREQSGRRR